MSEFFLFSADSAGYFLKGGRKNLFIEGEGLTAPRLLDVATLSPPPGESVWAPAQDVFPPALLAGLPANSYEYLEGGGIAFNPELLPPGETVLWAEVPSRPYLEPVYLERQALTLSTLWQWGISVDATGISVDVGAQCGFGIPDSADGVSPLHYLESGLIRHYSHSSTVAGHLRGVGSVMPSRFLRDVSASIAPGRFAILDAHATLDYGSGQSLLLRNRVLDAPEDAPAVAYYGAAQSATADTVRTFLNQDLGPVARFYLRLVGDDSWTIGPVTLHAVCVR